MVKNPPAMQELQEMRVQSLGQEDPRGRKWQPALVFLPGKSSGQRNRVGYSPCSHKFCLLFPIISGYLYGLLIHEWYFISHRVQG